MSYGQSCVKSFELEVVLNWIVLLSRNNLDSGKDLALGMLLDCWELLERNVFLKRKENVVSIYTFKKGFDRVMGSIVGNANSKKKGIELKER